MKPKKKFTRKKKKPRLQIKVPQPFGIKRGVLISFKKRCDDLGVNYSNMVESLIEQFLSDTK